MTFFLARLRRLFFGTPFANAESYWTRRYASGGNSGAGSYGKFAEFKAEVINGFVAESGVHSVIEFGCGDGAQLELARYPEYIGFDVSTHALDRCRARFGSDPHKKFALTTDYANERADLTLSLDVVYHLVEDAVFDAYMRRLFGSANRYVIVYSSNYDERADTAVPHIRHRDFVKWVSRNCLDWALLSHIPNRYPYEGDHSAGTFADFYVFARNSPGA